MTRNACLLLQVVGDKGRLAKDKGILGKTLRIHFTWACRDIHGMLTFDAGKLAVQGGLLRAVAELLPRGG